MLFECEGAKYDSAVLFQFPTGNEGMPLVFMTRDHARLFVVTSERWYGIAVHRAAEEVKALPARFGIGVLKRALR